MISQKIGRWTVTSLSDKPRYLKCVCDCGTVKDVRKDHLSKRLTLSCGCLSKEATAKRNTESAKHSMHATPTYKSWQAMRTRCLNENSSQYHRYGGRGISICKEWDDFTVFFRDMGERPTGTTLDRIDSNKGYSPDNCRWSTMKIQENNKRNNVLLTFNGKTQTVAQWADETGIGYQTIRARINMGWSIEEALTLPRVRVRRSSR